MRQFSLEYSCISVLISLQNVVAVVRVSRAAAVARPEQIRDGGGDGEHRHHPFRGHVDGLAGRPALAQILEPSPVILTHSDRAILCQGGVKRLKCSYGYAPRHFPGPDPKWLCQNGSI